MSSTLATAVANLVTTLETISGVTASYADYGILDEGPTYAIVLFPESGSMELFGMGSTTDRRYDSVIVGETFIHDTGDLSTWGLACFSLTDSIQDAIAGDDTLSGAVADVGVEYAFRGEVAINGITWKFMEYRFGLTEF